MLRHVRACSALGRSVGKFSHPAKSQRDFTPTVYHLSSSQSLDLFKRRLSDQSVVIAQDVLNPCHFRCRDMAISSKAAYMMPATAVQAGNDSFPLHLYLYIAKR